MNNSMVAILAACLLASSVPVAGQDCGDVQLAVKAKVDAVQKEYEGRFTSKKAEVDQWQKDLEKDMPHPNGVAATIGFDVKTKWTDRDFIFGLPSVTMRDQTIILHLPEITVKEQVWIWHKPVFWMGTTKCGQKPETVCESKNGGPPFYLPGIECYVKWTDMYCDLPQTKLEETKTILGVPEFAMREQKIIMGIPEFRMEQSKIVLRIPEITIENVKAEIDKAEERADTFQKAANDSLGSLGAELKSKIESATLGELAGVFDCQRKDLTNKELVALSEVDRNIVVIQASLTAASQVGAADLASQMQQTIGSLQEARAEIVKQFAAAAAKLDESQKAAFEGVEKGNQAPEPGAKPRVRFRTLRFAS